MCRRYCADLVQKRLHHDVLPLIDAMRTGFNLVSCDDSVIRIGVRGF
jgi:hypothetical protein